MPARLIHQYKSGVIDDPEIHEMELFGGLSIKYLRGELGERLDQLVGKFERPGKVLVTKKPRLAEKNRRAQRAVEVNSGINLSELGNHIEPEDLADYIDEARSMASTLRERGQTDQLVHNADLMGMILTMDGLYDPETGEFVDEADGFEITGSDKRNLKAHLGYKHKPDKKFILPDMEIIIPDMERACDAGRMAAQAVKESIGEAGITRAKAIQVIRVRRSIPDLDKRPLVQMILDMTG